MLPKALQVLLSVQTLPTPPPPATTTRRRSCSTCLRCKHIGIAYAFSVRHERRWVLFTVRILTLPSFRPDESDSTVCACMCARADVCVMTAHQFRRSVALFVLQCCKTLDWSHTRNDNSKLAFYFRLCCSRVCITAPFNIICTFFQPQHFASKHPNEVSVVPLPPKHLTGEERGLNTQLASRYL